VTEQQARALAARIRAERPDLHVDVAAPRRRDGLFASLARGRAVIQQRSYTDGRPSVYRCIVAGVTLEFSWD
jgi:hypothetical protein